MSGREFSIRKEPRFAIEGREVLNWRAENAYPCKDGCKENHRHNGATVLLYAHCSCGWEIFVGDHIYSHANTSEGRLQFLQHQINLLAGEPE